MTTTQSAPLNLSSLSRSRTPSERRTARRLTPGRLTPCLITAPGADEPIGGWLHNLSVKGAGFLTNRPFAPGTSLRLLLINAQHTFAAPVELQVTRCFRVVNGDFYLGGQFSTPLDYGALFPFLL
jgi:hypothetical protein